MMKWIVPMMWGFTRLLGWVLQLIGIMGLLFMAALAAYAFAGQIDR